MENQSLISKKMTLVMAEIGAVGKTQRNPQGWMFRGIDDVYNALHQAMKKHGVFCLPNVKGIIFREKIKNAKGTEGWHQILDVNYKFMAEDGSFVECNTWGESWDFASDKITNKCLSAAHKYALLQTFVIPVQEMEDPDKHSDDGQHVERASRRPQQQQQQQRHTVVPAAQQQQQKAEVKKLDERLAAFIEQVCAYFSSHSVSEKMLQEWLGCKLENMTEDHFARLRSVREKINTGMPVEEAFDGFFVF